MSHELLPPVIDDTFGAKTPLVKYACSCGFWHRSGPQDRLPRLQDIESSHEDHRQRAGAEELRAGKPDRPQFPHEALEDVLRAMAKIAKESVQAMEAMGEFIAAHKDAKAKGIGVVVVRQADGSTTSTPNVFVAPGTAIFMDEPSATLPLPMPLFEMTAPTAAYLRDVRLAQPTPGPTPGPVPITTTSAA
jgi:hypothetical protein